MWHGFCFYPGMMEKTILIAGGTGVLRQYLVDSLLTDPESLVVSVDFLTSTDTGGTSHSLRQGARFEHHRIDVEDAAEIAEVVVAHAPQTIIDLATETDCTSAEASRRWPASGNIIGTYHLLEAARLAWQQAGTRAPVASQRRFVQVSTAPLTGPPAEGGARSFCPYEEIVASRLADRWRLAYGLPTLRVSALNVFGPHQSSAHFVPRTIDALLGQRPIRLRRESRDWVYVEDAAEAIAFLSRHGVPGRDYRLDGIGGRFSELAIAESICDQLDQLVPRESGSYRDYLSASPGTATGGVPHRRAGVRPVQDELGWKPLNDFHCALAATVRRYVEHSIRPEQFRPAAPEPLYQVATG
jgi:dTDP-glucose 4,6-dehydratase